MSPSTTATLLALLQSVRISSRPPQRDDHTITTTTAQSSDALPETSQTVLYLLLGALLGVAYSLGTEKFIRAMHHRHVFMRHSMLWLAAMYSLLGAAAVATVASLIYEQSGGGLEGFDRVLGVLIPFVVRADLVVDWARRVAWALLNVHMWTQSSVQLRRILSRVNRLQSVVSASEDVRRMAYKPDEDIQADLMRAEHTLWVEDTESLVSVRHVVDHLEKLGRVALYCVVAVFAAIPGAIVWVFYAAYQGARSFSKKFYTIAILYWVSVLLSPPGAIAVILASGGLLCGVVTLSFVGTLIQFLVYWCTRTVYSVTRITLSQAWAGFPAVKRPFTNVHMPHNILNSPSTNNPASTANHAAEAEPASAPNNGTTSASDNVPVDGIPIRLTTWPTSSNSPDDSNGDKDETRRPEEAGSAMAVIGAFLPTELEFALASWDGKLQGHKSKPIGFSLSQHLFSADCFHPGEDEGKLEEGGAAITDDHEARPNALAASNTVQKHSSASKGTGEAYRARFSTDDDDDDDDLCTADDRSVTRRSLEADANEAREEVTATVSEAFRERQRMTALKERLGLDVNVRSARKRRLSTFYAMGMLANLQLESGGNAWCLHDVGEMSDALFHERIRKMRCFIADEACAAVVELGSRLRSSSKYRVVPSGAPAHCMVPVQDWLRNALLAILEVDEPNMERW